MKVFDFIKFPNRIYTEMDLHVLSQIIYEIKYLVQLCVWVGCYVCLSRINKFKLRCILIP